MRVTDSDVTTEWVPIHVARHYGLPDDPGSGLDGEGQVVAVIDLGECLDLTEVAADFAKLGLAMPDIRVIDMTGGPVSGANPASIETHIDIEVIASLCPRAALRVYRCGASFHGMADAITRAVGENVDVISISWGARENALTSGEISSIEKALAMARSASVTVCAAAGDFGASGMLDETGKFPANDPSGRVHCIYPGSSPQVLSCGGTEIVEARGHRREIVWNDTARKGLATGGGVSDQFPRPDWQAGLKVDPVNPQAVPGRIMPDVAAVAALRDWTFFDEGGKRDLEGGTSAVAPFYAALVALAGQQRRKAGKARLGFLNDRLYALAAAGGLFNDIREGHNRVLPGGAGYRAAPGFDACTGWGTPRIRELLAALASLP